MGRLRELLKKNPVAGWGLVIVLVAAIAYLIAGRLLGPPPQPVAPTRPAPAPVATPAPAPVSPPEVAETRPSPSSVVPRGPTGRADPFLPLVRQPQAGGPVSPPPGPPLPPPPFPLPPGQLPPPPSPTPGPGGPSQAAGIAVTGLVGNSGAVAIVVVDGKTVIVSSGDAVGDLRVLRIDVVRRAVTFSRAGRRFDVRMGGE